MGSGCRGAPFELRESLHCSFRDDAACPSESEAGQDIKELEAKSPLYETGKTNSVESWPVMLVGDSLRLGMFGIQGRKSCAR